ncbi:MAG TPA: coenzyme F420-0:L-glutamate ligase [Blastocatellia bacterium]|nr:coenzyme F420-0:L-glutamate ligase [Blastocatellia bacterium]
MEIRVIGVPGLPEIVAGDDLALLIARAARKSNIEILRGDVLVIAQKIVSKAEGRTVRLDAIEPSGTARRWAEKYGKDARAVEVVLRESRRIVRMERGVLISETRHGFVCANAGVDSSNTPEGTVVLLPEDPDSSARRIQAGLEKEFEAGLAVIIADTFGRPWREGLVNVAIGVAGIAPLIDYRGEKDTHGRKMRVTVIALADELASAAELVMRKTEGIPVAIIRGLDYRERPASAAELIRHPDLDLFR